MTQAWKPWGIVLGLLVLLPLGCGGGGSDLDLKGVSGTVTLDGQPLPDATVVFTPKGGGRQVFGLTDEDGEYELAYTTTGEGAPPGEYIVAIRTFRAPEEDPDTGEMKAAVPEKVPQKYNTPSELTVSVPSDSYDFALVTDGAEIVQPEILGDE